MTSDFNVYYRITVGDGVHGPGGWTATVDVTRRDTHATVWSSENTGSTSIAAREDAMDAGAAWCRRNSDRPPEGWNPATSGG
jgi:hypothetical protein